MCDEPRKSSRLSAGLSELFITHVLFFFHSLFSAVPTTPPTHLGPVGDGDACFGDEHGAGRLLQGRPRLQLSSAATRLLRYEDTVKGSMAGLGRKDPGLLPLSSLLPFNSQASPGITVGVRACGLRMSTLIVMWWRKDPMDNEIEHAMSSCLEKGDY